MNNHIILYYLHNVYPRGSRVYGVNSENSDFDYVGIIPDDYCKTKDEIMAFQHDMNEDISIYTDSEWKEKAERMDVDYLEARFTPALKMSTMVENYSIDLDYDKINESIAKTASNSWVKCKKKLTVEKDCEYIGKKSLWHSLRILMFGIQLMNTGRISDFECANFLYNDIINSEHNDWDYFKEKYQPIYNALHSQFKLAYEFRKLVK